MMKRTLKIGVVCLALSLVAVTARAEFTIDYLMRASGARAADAQEQWGWVDQGEVTLEWGDAQLAGVVTGDNGTAAANQSVGAFMDGQIIRIAGTMHGEVARTVAWDQDPLTATNQVHMPFSNPDPFVVHLEYEKTGFSLGSNIRIVDDMVGADILHIAADDMQGSITVVGEGSGSFVLEISHDVDAYISEPGERSGTMQFSIVLAPEGTVPVRDEAWSGVKALYR